MNVFPEKQDVVHMQMYADMKSQTEELCPCTERNNSVLVEKHSMNTF